MLKLKYFSYSLLLLIFYGCSSPKYLSNISENISVNQSINSDSTVTMWISPFKDSVELKMSKVIAKSTSDLLNIRYKGKIDQERSKEANLARVCADYIHGTAKQWIEQNTNYKVDFTISNYGGFRVSLFAGIITLGQIFELSPFDNEIVIVQLSGLQMDTLLNQIAQKGGCPISNAEIKISNDHWVDFKINGNNFDSRRTYWVATNDFMQQGGDGFTALKYPLKKIQTGILVRDALIQGFSKEYEDTGDINPKTQDRFIFN